MMHKDTELEQFEAMRREAERKAALNPEVLRAMSPEEFMHTVHELQVHQIELEMQNENLRAVHAQLDAARARYFDLYDLAPAGYLTLSEKGLILESNLTATTMLGVTRTALLKKPISQFILKEDQDIYYLHRKQLFEAGAPQRCELRMLKSDGELFWARLDAAATQDDNGEPACRVILSDITASKLHEEERELASQLVLLVNSPGDFHEHMAALTDALKKWSGCEAVGIRLKSGDDFPYYETKGFPPEFVHQETRLCACGPQGDILRDAGGSPVLECMCGNVLSGRVDPSKPFFTAQGSFWTNSTTALLTHTSVADRQSHTRNRCNSAGYESVALIPLHTGAEVFGLLQFNDHRPNRFTSVLIAHFERMADSLAIALSRRQAQEALEASKKLYQKLSQHLESVREEERTSLARELHDEIGQILTAIKIDLITMDDGAADLAEEKKKKDMQQLLSEGIQCVHSLCRQLRPGALDDLGLEEAIIGLVGDWKRRNKTECTVSADIDEKALSDQIKTTVFRIVQESLTNVSRYARASTVEINLVADVQNLRFSVLDDGRGMEEGAESKPTSFGLLGMHERVQVLGGELHIESSPGHGTRIEGSIPIPPKP